MSSTLMSILGVVARNFLEDAGGFMCFAFLASATTETTMLSMSLRTATKEMTLSSMLLCTVTKETDIVVYVA